ncbi:Dabb family protein [Mesorhizobium mediterraneum]
MTLHLSDSQFLRIGKIALRICGRLILVRLSYRNQPQTKIMIRHIVFFTAASSSNLEPILDGLALLTKIPHARRLEVAQNRKSDPASKEVDVIVYGEFGTDAELAAYKAHPLYQEAIKRVRPLRELRFAADYEIAAARTSLGENARQ